MVKLWMKMNGVMKNVKGACLNSTCTLHYVQWRSADQVEIYKVCVWQLRGIWITPPYFLQVLKILLHAHYIV